MSINLKNLEMTYSKLYEISSQIGQLIERELYSDLIGFVEKKDQLLAKSAELLKSVLDSGENTEHLKEICQKIEEQERKNLEQMQIIQDKIKLELRKNTNSKKVVNAYDTSIPEKGRILDFSE